MNLEHLLLWLSAKKQGSWSQFRGAVEQLCTEEDHDGLDVDDEGERPRRAGSDLPVYQQARFALQRLGHVEFVRQTNQDWRVVPPTLALFPGRSGEGVLCGARSPDLLSELANSFEVDREVEPGMPDRILLRGYTEAATRGASTPELFVQVDAPTVILSAAPEVRDPAAWFPTTVLETPGWTVHRFSSSRLGWVESTGKEILRTETGFFRFVMRYQRFYYLRWRGRSYSVPVQVGKYAVLRRRRGLLVYDASSLTLTIPATCRPPLLIERALVLSSGRLPPFNPRSRRLEYRNVLLEIARLASQLLRQKVAT